MKVNMPRPMTIIGQVRYSIISSISTAASRPKSVPIFDLDRYEKEILGVSLGKSDRRGDFNELECDAKGNQTDIVGSYSYLGINGEGESAISVPGDITFKESSRSRNSTFAGVFTDACKSPGQLNIRDGGWDLFPDHPTLSHSKEEEEREAKYREIVKALRRASSVVSRKATDQTAAGNNSTEAVEPVYRINGASGSLAL
ncbi:hypothetical protein BGZ58_006966 [Dissophora ornata]|nr:hypothetical protein BGZ58_006966 [Dissophora ornata]